MEQKKKKKKSLPEALETQRTRVFCNEDMNYHTSTMGSHGTWAALGLDDTFDFDEFREDFEIVVTQHTDDMVEFEMIGADLALANSLRRILIAEVPTVAIEHVFISNNTSIMQDDVLAHRLGLIPLAIDPALLEYKLEGDVPSVKNTVVFKLDVRCTRTADAGMINDKVYSGDLEWLPQGSELPEETSCRFESNQSEMFGPGAEPRATMRDILLDKMRPGQAILLEAHCIKGIGREHAKWSPVATAWYKLYPEVVLLQEIVGEDAQLLVKLCPGLFDLQETATGVPKLRVNNARNYPLLLEKVRRLSEQKRWNGRVQLRKRKDHFIFTIESTGVLPPEVLLEEALKILAAKCDTLADRL